MKKWLTIVKNKGLKVIFWIFQKSPLQLPKSFFFHRKVPLKIEKVYTFGPYFEKDPQKVIIRRIIVDFFRIFKKNNKSPISYFLGLLFQNK